LPFFPGPLELPSTTGFFSAFGGLPGFFKPLLFPPFCSPSTPFAGAMFPLSRRAATTKKRKRDANRRSKPLPGTLRRHWNNNNKSEESRKTCASPQVLPSSPPFLVPRSHVNFLVLFLFPVHTWFLPSIDYSSFTRKFSCPLPTPCSHFNFNVVFLVHTSVYHPFLVPRSRVNLPILFSFPIHTLILSSFGCSSFKCESSQLFLVPCSHVNITIIYFLLPAHNLHVNFLVFFFFPRSHVKFSVIRNLPKEFTNFGTHVHQENFIIYHPFFCSLIIDGILHFIITITICG
jgi:hypothetical protein